MEDNTPSSPEQTSSEQTTTESQAPAMVVEGSEGTETVEPKTLYANKYESVGELEKAYGEAQKFIGGKLGGFEGAPEGGYTLPEGDLSDSDQALVSFAQEWGAENQLSNTGLESLVTKYSEFQATQRDTQINQAYEQLGENADARLKDTRDFLTANLGEEATAALAANMNTAPAIQAIEKLIAMSKAPSPSAAPAAPGVDKYKVQEMRFKTNDKGERLMSIDPDYRKQVLAAESQLRSQG